MYNVEPPASPPVVADTNGASELETYSEPTSPLYNTHS